MSNKISHSATTAKVWLWLWVILAFLFGLATIKSGGQVLFGDESARRAAGNYVPFVLWFNFLAGFVYLLAAMGLFLQKRLSVFLPAFLALSTILVFLALGLHIFQGGAYEMRTVFAMGLRSLFWTSAFVFAYRRFWQL